MREYTVRYTIWAMSNDRTVEEQINHERGHSMAAFMGWISRMVPRYCKEFGIGLDSSEWRAANMDGRFDGWLLKIVLEERVR